MALTSAEKDETAVDQCAGCGTWHYRANMKQAQGKAWCVLCYPSPMEET
jgi:formylmethanofuran dehydrogenase subunit E